MSHADDARKALSALEEHGTFRAAAAALGIASSTLQHRVSVARGMKEDPADFVIADELPSALPSIADLLERRRKEFGLVHAAKEARQLINVDVKIDGPIGISHGGDPHLDDAGTNIALVEKHVDIVNRTRGMFGANVGDVTNNWVGRLARLYGEQATSAAEAWMLAEWYVKSVRWLYLVPGNHDVWSGAGDPIRWMLRQQPGVYEGHGARLNLRFSTGREVRVNARHDFKGHSMWNAAHGINKAVQMGWRDHILTCGHLHISGYNILKDPKDGTISHAIRVASYKHHDRYADALGLPDQNISENIVTIIDPSATEERCLVTTFMDLEQAAEFLTWKRAKFAQSKRVNV